MKKSAIFYLLFLVSCSNHELNKIDRKAPETIVYELGDSIPYDFVNSVEQTKFHNPNASIYVILPRALSKDLHFIKGVKKLRKHRVSLMKFLKTVEKKPYILSPKSLVKASLANNPNPEVVSDLSIHFSKKPGYFITGNGIRSLCTHKFDETHQIFDPTNVKLGERIFVHSDYLDRFIKRFHPHIQNPYYLITHNSDRPVPGKHVALLKDPKILAWYGQNRDHNDIIPLPIGIANSQYIHGNVNLIRYISELSLSKDILLYMNFLVRNNTEKRKEAFEAFIDKPYCHYVPFGDLAVNYLNVRRSKFVVSPEGNGLDCHRTWEALIMGAIPIVKTSYLDPLFKDLPVLIVNEWSDVTEELLNETYEKFKDSPIPEQVTLEYWKSYLEKGPQAL